jgi:methoxymalonate biosynthesis acyl carrier protein
VADRAAVLAKVQRILTDRLFVDAGVDEELLESGALDSARLVELVMHLESEFEMRVELETVGIESFRTPRSVSELVVRALDPAVDGAVP